ncbi:MAG TPA: hypothetical protein DEH25_07200 [Chloroflexi bacterium]|nr:hypothetical protein [Chloroflexota bacterium]HBY07250.1 hypothetical protein [Chloroflexota bacterium]
MTLNKSLCELEKQGFIVTDFKDYKKLVRHGEYVCEGCGRVARRKKNLCHPKPLYPKEDKKK